MKSLFKKTFILIFILSLFSCKHKEEKITAESLYLKAFEALQDKDYTTASEAFEKIDDEFQNSLCVRKAPPEFGQNRLISIL